MWLGWHRRMLVGLRSELRHAPQGYGENQNLVEGLQKRRGRKYRELAAHSMGFLPVTGCDL